MPPPAPSKGPAFAVYGIVLRHRNLLGIEVLPLSRAIWDSDDGCATHGWHACRQYRRTAQPLATGVVTLHDVKPVRQFVGRTVRGRVRREHSPATLDRSTETFGDTAIAHIVRQSVDRRLPF